MTDIPVIRFPLALAGAGAPRMPDTARPLIPWEAEAVAHYSFGGDATSLLDRLTGLPLVAAGVAPTFASNHLTLASGGANGLITHLDDRPALTVLLVIRKTKVVPLNEIAVLFGSATNTGEAGGELAFLLGSAAADTNSTRYNVRGDDVLISDSGQNHQVPIGDWYIQIIGRDNTAQGRFMLSPGSPAPAGHFVDDPGAVTKTLATPMRKLALGNAWYNQSTAYLGLSIAEAVIWPHRLTYDAAYEAAYRARARARNRGLTLPWVHQADR